MVHVVLVFGRRCRCGTGRGRARRTRGQVAAHPPLELRACEPVIRERLDIVASGLDLVPLRLEQLETPTCIGLYWSCVRSTICWRRGRTTVSKYSTRLRADSMRVAERRTCERMWIASAAYRRCRSRSSATAFVTAACP